MVTAQLIQLCKQQDRRAQRLLYDLMSPQLFLVCKRYLRQDVDIHAALTDAFYILFTKLHQLENIESFEAWARKIAVNSCLGFLRKSKKFLAESEEFSKIEIESVNNVLDSIEQKELLSLLDYLPNGAKAVFNLYAIEGYSHKEIAHLLEISEGTSKSQLNYAKTKLQALVQQHYFSKQDYNGNYR